jgi:hypothetical protein
MRDPRRIGHRGEELVIQRVIGSADVAGRSRRREPGTEEFDPDPDPDPDPDSDLATIRSRSAR